MAARQYSGCWKYLRLNSVCLECLAGPPSLPPVVAKAGLETKSGAICAMCVPGSLEWSPVEYSPSDLWTGGKEEQTTRQPEMENPVTILVPLQDPFTHTGDTFYQLNFSQKKQVFWEMPVHISQLSSRQVAGPWGPGPGILWPWWLQLASRQLCHTPLLAFRVNVQHVHVERVRWSAWARGVRGYVPGAWAPDAHTVLLRPANQQPSQFVCLSVTLSWRPGAHHTFCTLVSVSLVN